MIRKHNIARISVCLIFIFSFFLVTSIAYAQDAPLLPEFFYGKATINGRDVPLNSKVIAKINSEKRGEITVDIAAGQYGSETSDYKLAVIGNRTDVGKTIEFYVKLPGVYEIKSNQTANWQSSQVINLGLTFTGEEVPEPQDTGGSSVGGGSSGGGGGGVSGTQKTSQSSYYYDSIEAGKQISISINNPSLPLTKLQLILNNNSEAVEFAFEAVDAAAAPALDNAYKYISIEAPKITDDNVQTAILKFKIPNSWFTENNYDPKKVVLLRYHNNQWNELTTVHEGSDATDNYYRAGTPGFSYFAIKSGKAEATAAQPVTEETKKTNPAATKTEQNTESKESAEQEEASELTGMAVSGTEGKPNLFIGLAIIFAVIIMGVLIYFFVVKR